MPSTANCAHVCSIAFLAECFPGETSSNKCLIKKMPRAVINCKIHRYLTNIWVYKLKTSIHAAITWCFFVVAHNDAPKIWCASYYMYEKRLIQCLISDFPICLGRHKTIERHRSSIMDGSRRWLQQRQQHQCQSWINAYYVRSTRSYTKCVSRSSCSIYVSQREFKNQIDSRFRLRCESMDMLFAKERFELYL